MGRKTRFKIKQKQKRRRRKRLHTLRAKNQKTGDYFFDGCFIGPRSEK